MPKTTHQDTPRTSSTDIERVSGNHRICVLSTVHGAPQTAGPQVQRCVCVRLEQGFLMPHVFLYSQQRTLNHTQNRNLTRSAETRKEALQNLAKRAEPRPFAKVKARQQGVRGHAARARRQSVTLNREQNVGPTQALQQKCAERDNHVAGAADPTENKNLQPTTSISPTCGQKTCSVPRKLSELAQVPAQFARPTLVIPHTFDPCATRHAAGPAPSPNAFAVEKHASAAAATQIRLYMSTRPVPTATLHKAVPLPLWPWLKSSWV